jgi:hypothetical protein
MIDTTLGLNKNALKIMRLVAKCLRGVKADNGIVRTSAWYNGRERGVVISVHKAGKPNETYSIVIVEHRNSDDIVVYNWLMPKWDVNPPTVADFTDEAYKSAEHFRASDWRVAAKYASDFIKCYIKSVQPVSTIPALRTAA